MPKEVSGAWRVFVTIGYCVLTIVPGLNLYIVYRLAKLLIKDDAREK